jgi:hypothetical protein
VRAIRRVVTGHDERGRSRVVSDGLADTLIDMGWDCRVTELWATFEPRPANAGNDDAARAAPAARTPPPYGDKFRIIEFAPDEHVDMQALEDRLAKNLAAGRMLGEAKDGLHRSESLDYAIVLEGEVWHLTESDEVHLKAGDVLIQRGTYHAWRNRSAAPVLIAFVMRDAQPLRVHADPQGEARKAGVVHALQRWIAAMNTGQGPAPLVALYAPDAVLFATLNPVLLDTPEGVLGNFDGLADRQKKKGYKAELGRFVTHVFADAAVNTGYYTFSFLEDDGREVVKRYRFSFTYRRTGSEWLIVSHHSSPVPEKDLTPRPEKRRKGENA